MIRASALASSSRSACSSEARRCPSFAIGCPGQDIYVRDCPDPLVAHVMSYQSSIMNLIQTECDFMKADPDFPSLLIGFLESMRECMPDTAAVRDALGYTHMVLDHPCLTGEKKVLHERLWRLVTMDPVVPEIAAKQMRGLADRMLSDCDHSTTGQVLEMALHTLSLRFDDRPSARMLCVDLGMMAAGLEVVGIEDAIPVWKPNGGPMSAMSPGPVHQWVASHVEHVCESLLRRTGVRGAFAEWSAPDLECALLALRMQYCVFRAAMNGRSLGPVDLTQEFTDNGAVVWCAVEEALAMLPEGSVSARALRTSQWHASVRTIVRRTLGASAGSGTESVIRSPAVTSISKLAPSSAPVTDVQIPDGKPSLVVCRGRIIDAPDKYDKEEVGRHKILQDPLPLAVMPHTDDLLEMQRALLREFPWAQEVLATIFDDLYGRAKLGIRTFGFAPTLLVGASGSGKSRLAGRLADVFGIPRMDLSLGGTSDSKVLAGTSRGWGSGKPSDLATFLAIRKSASAVVLLDELDKATYGYGTGIGLQSYLLGMLEPETACRIRDEYLKTECDYSGVLWIATANTLSGIQAPLRTRLRTLLLRQPSAEHFRVIAENVLADISKGWSLEREVLPSLSDIELPWDRLSSARQVRKATEAAVMQWARELQRH